MLEAIWARRCRIEYPRWEPINASFRLRSGQGRLVILVRSTPPDAHFSSRSSAASPHRIRRDQFGFGGLRGHLTADSRLPGAVR